MLSKANAYCRRLNLLIRSFLPTNEKINHLKVGKKKRASGWRSAVQ